ncbi:MAG TPA: GNAT family N-acetyltransferase [Gaiellaceae bacterium]|jgi:mycothiol synthase
MTAPEGFAIRPATPADAAAVAELMNAFERAHVEEPDTVDADEVREWWALIEPERDSRLYFAADGRLAGAATLSDRNPDTLDLDAYVLPEHAGQGLGGAMVDWLEQEAAGRGLDRVQSAGLTADAAAGRLLRGRGYEEVRRFYRMQIDLEGPPPPADWPEGFEVSTFRPGDEAILHAVTEEAFAEHWGHHERDLDHWRRHTFGASWWDPSLVYLVRSGDEVAAASVNAFRFGGGWVGTIGTRKPWRGRGLGRALLLEAFGEFHRRGEARVSLAVDAGNETGATHLYESVGMRVVWQADVYERHLIMGEPLVPP